MRSPELTRRKDRIDNLIAEGRTLKDEVQSHWARYLCVLISGFIDESVRETVHAYVRKRSHLYVQRFVDKRLRFPTSCNLKKIDDIIRDFFGEHPPDDWKRVTEEMRAAVDGIATNRNKIAHGGDVGLGFVVLKGYYKSVVGLVEVLEKTFD